MLEPLFVETDGPWIFSTSTPSLADITLYYQFLWGNKVASGEGVYSITMEDAPDSKETGSAPVFNSERYPGIHAWYKRMERYFEELPSTEEDKTNDFESVLEQMKKAPTLGPKSILLPTPRSAHQELSEKIGLKEGASVSVTPSDTGRDE